MAEQSHPAQMYIYAMSVSMWPRRPIGCGRPPMKEMCRPCSTMHKCAPTRRGKTTWLTRAANAGHLDAAYQLLCECQSLADKQRWSRMAAEDGHVSGHVRSGHDLHQLSRTTMVVGRGRAKRLAASHLSAGN